MTPDVESYDLFDNTDPPATSRDIYHSGNTVFRHEPTGIWLIAGHPAVRAVLGDAEQYSNDIVLAPICPPPAEAGPLLAGMRTVTSVVNVDPPEHTRRRAALNDLFPHTRASVRQRWGDLVSRQVDAVVNDLSETAAVDMVDVAARVTVPVLCEVLGLPVGDQNDLRAWTMAFARFAWSDLDQAGQHAALESAAQMWDYCQQLVTDRATPSAYGPGIVGDLLRYRDDNNQPLPVTDVVGEVLNFIGAGWVTTASAICHVVEQALAEPGAWARLAADSLYLDALVTEVLRLRPPLIGWQRRTTRPVTVDGVTIPAGSRCLLRISAANRDPNTFPTPDRFNLERHNNGRHTTFGVGARRCIGEQLARLEITTTARTLAQRLPQLRIDPDQSLEYERSAVLLVRRALPALTGCPVAHSTYDPASASGEDTGSTG